MRITKVALPLHVSCRCASCDTKGSVYTESIILSDLFVCTLHRDSLLLSSFLLFVPINILLLLFNKYNLSKLSLGLLTFIRLSEHCQESSPHRILTYKWCNQRRRPWHYQLMQSWHQYHIGNSYWSCYRPLWRTFKS